MPSSTFVCDWFGLQHPYHSDLVASSTAALPSFDDVDAQQGSCLEVVCSGASPLANLMSSATKSHCICKAQNAC
jgi:hypothetical protein